MLIITQHALDRFRERIGATVDLERQLNLAVEWKRLENATFWVLPCGAVAVIQDRTETWIVKTVLTRHQAEMQLSGMLSELKGTT